MADCQGSKVIGKFSFRRGVHPADRKGYSSGAAISVVGPAAGVEVVLPMSQHIGAPCKPAVEAKAEVTAGQVVGAAEAFVSAPVHSPVNGVVKEVGLRPHPSGKKVLSVVIVVGEEQPAGQVWRELPAGFDSKGNEPEAIVNAIREAGIVGQGGAAFPTAVKLTANPSRPVDTVILNGCECEPYLTSDHRLMLEAPGPIVAGLQLALRASGAKRGIITIEDNKPDAIEVMSQAIGEADNLQVAICKTKYPQGWRAVS